MIVIGEKINGTRNSVKSAILNRDNDYITRLAVEQSEAGADYIDVNAGTNPDRETDDMLWLLEVVQSVSDVPICIDSSSSETLRAALSNISHTPLINSINADIRRLDNFLPIIKEKDCPVIALALNESTAGMPKNTHERLEHIKSIFEATRTAGIKDDKLFVDPLIMSVSTDNNAGIEVLECIRMIRKQYPDAHITGGLSNISFGLPKRELVNRTFLTLAIEAGMDSAVCDPSNTALIESLMTTDLLLGRDRFCRRYTVAAKQGFVKSK